MATTSPQLRAQNVLRPVARAAIFLTVTVPEGREADARDALTDVPSLIRAVAFRVPEGQLSCVTGIGAEFWQRAYADLEPPADLHPFIPLEGAKHRAPGTPGDLLFHIRSMQVDMCFELARQFQLRFGDAIEIVDEVHGFRYWDDRDLLGFVDGTENPDLPLAQVRATLIDNDPVWSGGSFVIVQKYLHDLSTWDAISVEEQERVIGRTKLSDVELPDDVKPSNSHVALNQVNAADGQQLQIVRDNLPFGRLDGEEFGTYFIGYAADPGVTEEMLRNMFLGKPPGNYDRILDFSTAVTGCLFFVPPAGFLEDPQAYAPEPADSDEQDAPDDRPASDGSLNIGSLRSTQ